MLRAALRTQQNRRHSGLPFCGVHGAAHAHERVERASGGSTVERGGGGFHSSGKIGRRACRTAYIDGSLRSGTASPNSFPDQAD